jgi:hypothetical protein
MRGSQRRYLTDENIRQSVVLALRELGCDVTESRTVSPGAPDQVLEQLAADQGFVLMTHDRDFKYSASKKTRRELREAATTVQLLPLPNFETWLPVVIPIIESQLTWAEANDVPVRVIRVKDRVVNVELAF